jgi:ammonium transporter, Amt family
MAPHSLTLTMVGACMLWVGWFGFNAGSNLEATSGAALAFINTLFATAAAVLAWCVGEALTKGKASMLGAASGAVAGLVAITPACGSVGPMGGIVIGAGLRLRLPVGRQRPEAHARRRRLAGRVRRARRRRHRRRAADRRVRGPGPGRHRGDDFSIGSQLLIQAEGVLITIVWSAVVAFIAYKIVDMVVGLRVSEESEREGLDITSHGETAYNK